MGTRSIFECPYCALKGFNGLKGVGIHITRTHPEHLPDFKRARDLALLEASQNTRNPSAMLNMVLANRAKGAAERERVQRAEAFEHARSAEAMRRERQAEARLAHERNLVRRQIDDGIQLEVSRRVEHLLRSHHASFTYERGERLRLSEALRLSEEAVQRLTEMLADRDRTVADLQDRADASNAAATIVDMRRGKRPRR